jgi:hypothetical protein
MKSFALAMLLVGWPIVTYYSLHAALYAVGPVHCGSRTPRWKKLADEMFKRLDAPSDPPR